MCLRSVGVQQNLGNGQTHSSGLLSLESGVGFDDPSGSLSVQGIPSFYDSELQCTQRYFQKRDVQ